MDHLRPIPIARFTAIGALLALSATAAATDTKTPTGLPPAHATAPAAFEAHASVGDGIPVCIIDGFDYRWRLEAAVVSPPPRIELTGEVFLSESQWDALDGLITPNGERFRLVAINPEADNCNGPSTSWFEYVLTRTDATLEGEWRSYCTPYPNRGFRDGGGNIDGTIVPCPQAPE